MSIAEAVIEKLNTLPPEKQEKVLDYVKSLEQTGSSAPKNGKPHAWLELARNAKVQGPPDWSENLDDYLYGR